MGFLFGILFLVSLAINAAVIIPIVRVFAKVDSPIAADKKVNLFGYQIHYISEKGRELKVEIKKL